MAWKINPVTNSTYWEDTPEEARAKLEALARNEKWAREQLVREKQQELQRQWQRLREKYPAEFDDDLVIECMKTDEAARSVLRSKKGG